MSKESISVAAYNIASGGFESYSYELETPERLGQISKAIRVIDADFIGLVDTFRWEEEFTSEELLEIFDYNFAHSINLEDERLKELGHNNGITILTNLPVIESRELFIYSRNCIENIVDVGGTKIQIFTVYLDDISEDTRQKQIDQLIKHVRNDMPVIIMGDLNSINPEYKIQTQKGMTELFKAHPELKKKVEPVLQDMLRGEVITRLTEEEFQIVSKNLQPTLPTPFFMNLDYKTPFIALDHILIKGDVDYQEFSVRRERLFDRTSDHYPVFARLLIED